ncbi:MAG: hypothetical protein F6J87_04915 [Spirulina sp. SIO3F2]|nr:hypothetical protein [Spirulina sp. SIO3F2]
MRIASIIGSTATMLLLSNVPIAKAEFSANWELQILGVYQSEIWGAGEFLSGITEFQRNEAGVVEGRYTMNEQGEVVPGSLSQCQSLEPLVMHCIWQDRYGTGDLELSFSEDFSRFEGYWGDGNTQPEFPWLGSR